jgi:transposase-like protein
MFRLCFLFKATFQMTNLAHLCTMLPEIAAQIVALNNNGQSVRYSAQHLNIPRSTVQDALSRFRETHGFTRRPDLIIAGQQLMTVFCVFPYREIGDCHQLSLLDD